MKKEKCNIYSFKFLIAKSLGIFTVAAEQYQSAEHNIFFIITSAIHGGDKFEMGV